MLYPKSNEPALSDSLFLSPSSEYRAAPFWAWNCELERDTLLRQIGIMQRMGMGGFHMHTRVGMRTPYLSDSFFDLIEACAGEAERRGMLAYLYDEDKWPSGYAGGLVTKEPRFRQKYLCFTPDPKLAIGVATAGGAAAFSGKGEGERPFQLLGMYSVELDADGCLARYERLEHSNSGGNIWYAYLGACECNEWFNGYTYADTLSKEAVVRFAQVTHERYWERLGNRFGKSVPAIFTDEPQTFHKQRLPEPQYRGPVYIAFTGDFDDTFRAAYGYSLLDRLPELFWDQPEGAPSQARYHYHDHATERFASAFADTLGEWCEGHGLALTGHMMEEPTLRSQTNMTGEAMRSYRGFTLPGIDLLCDARELNTAKQCQSAVHQYGREGALSELYGVTGWDFPFRDHKLQGDWQAALGITLRVPHLYWVSMGGEAKRDYPASIGHQSPWYEQYPLVENHFARLNTALTRGRPHVRLGVIHPIESYWLHWGPESRSTAGEAMDRRFAELTEWLLYGLIDFDFLCESLLPSLLGDCSDGRFRVGEMAYDALLVPGCETLRSTTLNALEKFVRAGGRLIFAGAPPRMTDAVPDQRAAELSSRCVHVPWEHDAIIASLDPVREVDIDTEDETRSFNLLYQLRDDGEERWLFVSHANPPADPDAPAEEQFTLLILGQWTPVWYDTLTGRIEPLECDHSDGLTRIPWHCFCHDSLLLRLLPAGSNPAPVGSPPAQQALPAVWSKLPTQPNPLPARSLPLASPDQAIPVTLSEPNALLLDMAEWRLDDGEWQKKEEILHIENKARDLLGLPRRCNSASQPWLWPDLPAEHTLSIRMTLHSGLALSHARLALENPEVTQITLNGQRVGSVSDGWYVDEAIRTLPLPPLPEGESELILTIPFGIQSVLEWCYLLGDFGVVLSGCEARLTGPVRALRFGNIVPQGLPFYTGNITYHCTLEGDGKPCGLRVSSFLSPVLSVSLDGADCGRIAFAPYRLELGSPGKGKHSLDITLFGNRHNGFGPVHSLDQSIRGYGPGWWFTEGAAWSEEYVLRKNGILLPPVAERG